MKELFTRLDLKYAIKIDHSIVLFGKPDCIHCSIMKNCLSTLEKEFPSVSFHETKDYALAETFGVDEFPTLVFFENNREIGRIVGSEYVTKLRHVLNLWFLKD